MQEPPTVHEPSLGPVNERARHASVTPGTVSVHDMAHAVADPRCGAVVTFDGVVRNHDDGRGVDHLIYEAHPDAAEVMRSVVHELAEAYPDVIIAAAHRYGALQIGDSALAAAVASAHRKRAFQVMDELVDRIKATVPIWKHEFFDDGTSEWVAALG